MNNLKEWMPTLLIVSGGLWAGYTFVWKEILMPEWAPAALTLDVSMAPTGRRRTTGTTDAEAVEMQVTVNVTNESNRTLHLLPSFWQVAGTQVQRAPNDHSFADAARVALHRGSLDHAERLSLLRLSKPIATGSLLADDTIQPGEKLSRNVILRIPRTYIAATVELFLPTLIREPDGRLFNGQVLEWTYQADGNSEGVRPSLCQPTGPSASCRVIDGRELNREMKDFDRRSVLFVRSRQVPL